jgi:hypothetical protein
VAKYSPLRRHLAAEVGSQAHMTFAEIDELIGGLPASARRHRAWWSNERDGRHVPGPRMDRCRLDRERCQSHFRDGSVHEIPLTRRRVVVRPPS